MTGPVIAAAALVLGLMAFAFVVGTPILAVPIVVLALAAFGVVELGRRRKQARQMQGVREEAKADKVEFTDRDKETLTTD